MAEYKFKPYIIDVGSYKTTVGMVGDDNCISTILSPKN